MLSPREDHHRRRMVAHQKAHIDRMEAHLHSMCPKRVTACSVPGYEDPPERHQRAAAVQSHFSGLATPEQVRAVQAAVQAGTMPRPEWAGFSHEIHETKQAIVKHRQLLQTMESPNEL